MAETRPGSGQERLCDICHRRPAAVRVTVGEDGRRRTLTVCEQDYARLRAQSASPFESLFGRGGFGGGLFDDFFGDEGEEGELEGAAPRRPGRRRGRGRRDREAVDLADYLS